MNNNFDAFSPKFDPEESGEESQSSVFESGLIFSLKDLFESGVVATDFKDMVLESFFPEHENHDEKAQDLLGQLSVMVVSLDQGKVAEISFKGFRDKTVGLEKGSLNTLRIQGGFEGIKGLIGTQSGSQEILFPRNQRGHVTAPVDTWVYELVKGRKIQIPLFVVLPVINSNKIEGNWGAIVTRHPQDDLGYNADADHFEVDKGDVIDPADFTL